MRKLLLIILFFAVVTGLIAQDSLSFAAFKAGISNPMGSYGSETLPNGSFTYSGAHYSIEGAWFFSDHFGIGGQAGYDVHPVDDYALAQAKLVGDKFLEELTISSDPFKIYSGFLGTYYSLALSKKFMFTCKLMAGMQYGQTPYQVYKAEYFLVGKNWYDITSASDYGFAGLASASVEYFFNPFTSLYFDAGGSYSQLEYVFGLAGNATRTEVKDVFLLTTCLGIKIHF